MTSIDAPFVTVLMPVFNAEKFLRQSITSVLHQEFSDFELLIVDDGSTDDSLKIAREFTDPRVQLLPLPANVGFVEALNQGLAKARAPWIARQDADDLSRFDRLQEQVNRAMENPEADFLYSDAHLINNSGIFCGMLHAPENEKLLRWDLCFRNAIPHSSVMFRHDKVFDNLKGYKRDNVSADYDLWTRLLANGRAVKCEGALVSYRQHAKSIMGTENDAVDKVSSAPLREIMGQNISRFAGDSIKSENFREIMNAWTDCEDLNWKNYFEQRDQLMKAFLIKESNVVGMNNLLAQQDYTLFHRMLRKSRGEARKFLQACRAQKSEGFAHLPWFKIAASFFTK
ncbi:MAG: glycosyltransferase [Chthoniobacterales bacterium]